MKTIIVILNAFYMVIYHLDLFKYLLHFTTIVSSFKFTRYLSE